MKRTCLYILVLSVFVLLNVDLSSEEVPQRGACFSKYLLQCNNDEFSCLNGKCISRHWYCDDENDCGDNSDEQHCNSTECPKNTRFMKCKNALCIPEEWFCDGKTDCPSGDDEKNCGNVRLSSGRIDSARQQAIKWLYDYSSDGVSMSNWGYLSHKAVVALYLSEADNNTFSSGLSSQKELADVLSIQLLSKLAHKRIHDLPSSDLPSFVNALLVTCRNPRQFYGINLVKELRIRVDKENYTNPYDLLTLCNAGDTITESDTRKLVQAFQSNHREFWTDIQSIAVMALACAGNQPGNSVDSKLMKDLTMELKTHQYRNGTVESVQTTALVMQALYSTETEEDLDSFDEEKALKQILAGQEPDGSFGSFMKTYYVLPVLNCKSLVNLSSSHCQAIAKDEMSSTQDLINLGGSKIRIQYSLWMGDGKEIERTLSLKVPTNTSFYGIMEIAAGIDDKFRFEYVTKNRKPYINAVSRILDDPEGGIFWFPYRIQDREPLPILTSPADLIPKENEHLVMWYRSGTWID